MKIFRLRCTLALLSGIALLAITAGAPALACVGKTLHIATAGSVQQDILANALALLISERTGTTTKVDRFSDAQAAHDAIGKADLDIVVAYTAQARSDILNKPAIAENQALYEAVREEYNQNLNLVWLAPFGFSDAKLGQAAPVARKDTLKKFPALARLINKLGDIINDSTMAKLEGQVKGGKTAAEVARAFLKESKLI
ncbi:MAG: glycine betaine ABC transporter substrate-binding protein [Desulfuromonadales bacterium]|nr:glycine betaine ABC transporter substrate-binding protein [Desulfuromonadales bacterium]